MNIAILGTGMVGNAIGTKLIQLGHKVMMGSRTSKNSKAEEWIKHNGENSCHGTFAEAAKYGEIIFNCTAGHASIEALNQAGKENINGKILIDISNPLDFSKGMPPLLSICNTDSLGEQIQKAFPEVKVVKTLNTVNCNIMVNPSMLSEPTDIFVCGNDKDAKEKVKDILMNWFGWQRVIDMGDITTARGTEMILPAWIRLWGVLGTPNFNFRIVQ